jgi:NAD(P)H-dependent FMN reductase
MTAQDADSTPLTVAVIVGSVRQPRLGRVVANWFAALAQDHDGIRPDIIDLADIDLPAAETRPGGCETSPISDRLAAADAYVVVTPEYNHGYPAALKNAIDWHYREWRFKPVAFVSYGAGSGGVRAVEQLRLVFAELYCITTRNAVAITAPWDLMTDTGSLQVGRAIELAAHATLDEMTWWATTLRVGRQNRPYAV